MDNIFIITLTVIVGGTIMVFLVYLFSKFIYERFFCRVLLEIPLEKIIDSFDYSECLEKRNEFFANFGQIIITIFVIIVLTILLLTKTISAEAGLPILSAITGFAISSVASIKSKKKPEITNKEKPNKREY